MAAIRTVTYWSATKVALHCREAFWERDGISGGASFCDGRIRQTYYPPVESDPASGAALLASYTIGDDADVLGRMPATVRHAEVIQELSKMHPELLRPGMVVDAVSFAWGQNWWSEGAGVVRWGKDACRCEEERVQATRAENRLFFAGSIVRRRQHGSKERSSRRSRRCARSNSTILEHAWHQPWITKS